jgi:prepilin-type N-terminal cleavage/methylation domain-containing protein
LTVVPRLGYRKLMRMGDLAGVRIRHPREESGFTLIEMLVVLAVVAVLVAVALPAYLTHRDRAGDVAAGASVRQALPAVEAYFQEHGTYVGMTPATLRAEYDQALPASLMVGDASPTGYCVQATLQGRTWSLTAGGSIVAGGC